MDPNAEPRHAVDASGALAVEINCRQCGYNLRGLMPTGLCSECGAPISHSLRVDLLRYANPEWLRKVSTGVRIIVWMILIGFLGGIASQFVRELAVIISLTMTAVGVFGAWLLTEPEPGGAINARMGRARKIIRIAVMLAVASQLLSLIYIFSSVPEFIELPFEILVALLGLASIVGEYFKFALYEHFAARIPDKFLKKRAGFLRVALPVTLVVLIVFAFGFGLLASAGAGSVVGVGIVCFGVPMMIAIIVFAVMTLFLLLRLNKALKQQAALARDTWAAATPSPDTAPSAGF